MNFSPWIREIFLSFQLINQTSVNPRFHYYYSTNSPYTKKQLAHRDSRKSGVITKIGKSFIGHEGRDSIHETTRFSRHRWHQNNGSRTKTEKISTKKGLTFCREYIFQPLIFRGHVSLQRSTVTVASDKFQYLLQTRGLPVSDGKKKHPPHWQVRQEACLHRHGHQYVPWRCHPRQVPQPYHQSQRRQNITALILLQDPPGFCQPIDMANFFQLTA